MAQGLDYLDRNPYYPNNKKEIATANLTKEQKELRYKLLRRKSAIDHRLKVLPVDHPDRLVLETKMEADIAELALQIAPLGGVPKRWLSQLL